jgi:fluoride ion exporter CrcB/FEX
MTTFSTWQYQCQKNFFLQWSLQETDAKSALTGSRFIEWIVSLWIGVVLPLSALHVGHQLATLSPFCDANLAKMNHERDDENVQPVHIASVVVTSNDWKERLIICFYLLVTIVLVIVPFMFPAFSFISTIALLGCIGSYIRYCLSSSLNVVSNTFFYGTFAANVGGSWLYAVFTSLSKFVIPYANIQQQAVLFGLIDGFCGCLTTVSTFVVEIDRLSPVNAYIYSFLSNAVAQFGMMLFYSIVAYASIPKNMLHTQQRLDSCQAYTNLCTNALQLFNCPNQHRVITACRVQNYPSSWVGMCACGNFKNLSEEVSDLLIDSQLRSVITSKLMIQWSVQSTSPLTLDACISFESLCSAWLRIIECPGSKKIINGCHRLGLLHSTWQCSCGNFNVSKFLHSMMITAALSRGYDLIPYMGYPLVGSVNLCTSFLNTCSAW